MNKDQLILKLKDIVNDTRSDWLVSLEKRKLEELEFHNKNRDQAYISNLHQDMYEKLHGNEKYYRTVELSVNYLDNWIKIHSSGKIFLDYACGNGFYTIKAAKAGADLSIGIDISDISIKNAQSFASKEGVSQNTFFLQADCENTRLPDSSVDVVLCSGMLHHLDLKFALLELRRILKPGGIVYVYEALDYNPLIKFYRAVTPQMRTEWEKSHILSHKDIKFASNFFEIKDIRYWHLFSIAGAFFPFALPVFNSIDKMILSLPLIKMMSWMITFEMHK